MRGSTWVSGCVAGALVLGAAGVGVASASTPPQRGTPHVQKDYAGRLFAIDAFSATQAWAVGKAGDTMLALHWDGVTWVKVDAPEPVGATSIQFDGVTVIAPDDVWAVGHVWLKPRRDPWQGLAKQL